MKSTTIKNDLKTIEQHIDEITYKQFVNDLKKESEKTFNLIKKSREFMKIKSTSHELGKFVKKNVKIYAKITTTPNDTEWFIKLLKYADDEKNKLDSDLKQFENWCQKNDCGIMD